MASDLRLVIRVTGDASNLKAELAGATLAVQGLGQAATTSGTQGATGLAVVERQATAVTGRLQETGTAVQTMGRAMDTAGTQVGGLNLRLAAATAVGGLVGDGVRTLGNLLQGALFGGIAGVTMQLAGMAIQMLSARDATVALEQAQEPLHRALERSIGFFETAAERARRLAEQQRNLIALDAILARTGFERELAQERRALALLEADRAERIDANRNLPGFNPDGVLREPLAQRRAAIERLEALIAQAEAERERALTGESGAEREARERAAGQPPRAAAAPARAAAARDPGFDQMMEDLQRGAALTQQLRTPMEVLTDRTAEYQRLLGGARINQETFNRAMAQAREEFERADPAARQAAQAMGELSRMGEQGFDRVGQSITQALAQGQLDFKRLSQVGMAVASELTQAFLRLAIINPLKNALFDGPRQTTLSDIVGLVGGSYRASTGAFYGSGPAAADASAGGFLFHTGGIVGADRAPFRAAPAALFADAPRYHAGGIIGPGEVPAILQQGEGVFTPQQMARLAPVGSGAGGAVVNLTVNVSGSAADGAERDPMARRRLGEEIGAIARAQIAAALPAILAASRADLTGEARRGGAFAKEIGRR